jgi:hypothetical protein
MEVPISDPSGPSPRFTEPGIMDMHPSDPRRQGALFISRAVDRVVDLSMSLVSERMIPIMAALDELVVAVNDEIDTIAVAVQQMANHSAVRSDGQLTSLAQRIRNSTQSLKDALAQANTSGDMAGNDPNAPTTVSGGQSMPGPDAAVTNPADVDRGTTPPGFGGLGASAGTVVGPTPTETNPDVGLQHGTPESASSTTGSVSPSETLLNPDNPSPQAGTPTGPGQEKSGGTAGANKVD